MQISSLLKPEQIKLELVQTKRCNAINEVAQLLQPNPNVTNFAGFYEELLARERIESTCPRQRDRFSARPHRFLKAWCSPSAAAPRACGSRTAART